MAISVDGTELGTEFSNDVVIETMVHIKVGEGILIAVTIDEAREIFHELGQYLNRLND